LMTSILQHEKEIYSFDTGRKLQSQAELWVQVQIYFTVEIGKTIKAGFWKSFSWW
jgi:hypothetical protein